MTPHTITFSADFAAIEAATLERYPLLKQVTPQGNLRRKFCLILHNLEQLGFDPRVTETLRTRDRQAELVRTGRSQTQNSLHLPGPDGLARAMDVVDRRLLWAAPERFWITLGRLALVQGCHWGGFFGLPTAERTRLVKFLTARDVPFRPENWKGRRGWDPAHVEQLRG